MAIPRLCRGARKIASIGTNCGRYARYCDVEVAAGVDRASARPALENFGIVPKPAPDRTEVDHELRARRTADQIGSVMVFPEHFAPKIKPASSRFDANQERLVVDAVLPAVSVMTGGAMLCRG